METSIAYRGGEVLPGGEQATGRGMRAGRLFREGAIERITRDVYVVQMPGHEPHAVRLDELSCDCADYAHHAHIPEFRCYHILALEMYREWLAAAVKACAPYFGRVA